MCYVVVYWHLQFALFFNEQLFSKENESDDIYSKSEIIKHVKKVPKSV